MRLSTRVSIAVTTLGLVGWGALYGLFFWSSTEYGVFPDAQVGQVRGSAIQRFRLAADEVLIASRKGGADARDVLMLTESENHSSRVVYVVREQDTLVFEQRVNADFDAVTWNAQTNQFMIESTVSTEELMIHLDTDGNYTIAPAR